MDNEYELIISIVNSGFSDMIMEHARSAGARGGTIISGRGTASKEAEDRFGISIHPDKEVILIITNKDNKEAILKALYENAGLNTDCQGFTFSLPVDDIAGIKGE